MLLTALAVLYQFAAAPEVERAVLTGIEAGAFPGAVVVVGTRSQILYQRGFGRFTWSEQATAPDPVNTLFDLASLTKVVATTPIALALVERGALDLDRPVQSYLSGFTGVGKDRVTVRQLLEHRSGLRAFLPLNTETATAEEARARVLAEPLRWPPGSRVEYSDLNAMLLGWVLESVAGRPLDQLAVDLVFGPIGMRDAQFRPPRALRDRIMPVGLWRGHAIAGEIHDQNAARLGGVSGHAGLYATAADLAKYAQTWLNDGTAQDRPVFRPSLVRLFRQRGPGNRALGWEMRDTTTSDNTGTLFSATTFGHTGYTGTSIWIDPDRGLFVVLLTNRVFAPRTGRSLTVLKRVRGDIADAAVRLLAERLD